MKSIVTWGNVRRRTVSFVAILWPLLFVLIVIATLLRSYGTGSVLDASTWPAIKKLAQERVNEPEISTHLRIMGYYSVVSFSVGLFLLLNSLIFLVRVRAIGPVTERRNSAHLLSGLGVFLRGVVVAAIAIWLAKLVWADPADKTQPSDEAIVLCTFILCAVADFSVLVSLLIESGISKLLKNRELVGALLYIDLPTIIGIWIIMYCSPDVLKDTKAPDMIFTAIAGGTMIIHIVFSQLILSFLIAEEELGKFLGERGKEGSRSSRGARRSALPAQTPVAHSG